MMSGVECYAGDKSPKIEVEVWRTHVKKIEWGVKR